MVTTVELVKRGYFPKELPPPFATESFGTLLENPAIQLPLGFASRKNSATSPARHSLVRAGALRRQLSVPNPISFYRLAECLQNNWTTVEQHCQNSAISLSRPTLSSGDRSVVSSTKFHEQPGHRASLRATSKYILKTDISNCYSSIYTHSLAWALHTKTKAKAKRNDQKLLGNRLDKIGRSGQDGQSIGIPISPDTSFVLAEILLSSVDREICKRLENNSLRVNGFRSWDDFEFGFTTRADAESAIAIIQSVLGEYELQLNPTKTTVIELPVPVEDAWASELRTFSVTAQTHSLRRYFDRSFEIYAYSRNSAVLGYAVQRLRSVEIDERNWKACQDFLLQCAMVEPSTLPSVIDHLHFYKDKKCSLEWEKISDVLNILIKEHAPLNHGSEVAWALWGFLLFDCQIDKSNAPVLGTMEDPFVVLLALHALQVGLISNIDVTNWEAAMTAGGLRESQWLLSYEANVKGWLGSPDGKDHVSADAEFGFLKRNSVSFYDCNKVKYHAPSERTPFTSGGSGGGGYPGG